MQKIETPEQLAERKFRAADALITHAEKTSKKNKNSVFILYLLLSVLLLLLILTPIVPHNVQFYTLLFAAGVAFVIYAFIFALQESSKKLESLVNRYIRTEEEL